jgi:hypothetical protein
VLFDPEERWTFTEADVGSRARNTPFFGREMIGRVALTLLDGRATWESPSARTRLTASAVAAASTREPRSLEASQS